MENKNDFATRINDTLKILRMYLYISPHQRGVISIGSYITLMNQFRQIIFFFFGNLYTLKHSKR